MEKLLKFLFFILLFQTGFSHEFDHLLQVGTSVFNISVMDTKEKTIKGLSGTAVLPKGYGVLFTLFDPHSRPHFWMKDVTFPIDIIWINKNRVVQITENVPPPKYNQKKLPLYYSLEPVDTVLEINAGEARQRGIKIGDRVL